MYYFPPNNSARTLWAETGNALAAVTRSLEVQLVGGLLQTVYTQQDQWLVPSCIERSDYQIHYIFHSLEQLILILLKEFKASKYRCCQG